MYSLFLRVHWVLPFATPTELWEANACAEGSPGGVKLRAKFQGNNYG
jgi:hypothetical protein